ncbi:transposase family protein [Kitasatospora sp. NPDC002227]|uniref:transposase family protein n=1 Tax=Kitasatospora sp. NPDC002227 TaxID=3154773 RepID=UPI00332AE5DC
MNKNSRAGGAGFPVYQSRLPLSNATVTMVADLLRGRMEAIGSRWVLEVIGLLAARAPRLVRALHAITRSGGEVVLIDGTLVRTRRRTGRQDRRDSSGKHKAHGLLFLAVTDERGNLLWISAARPGRASDLTAARHNKICAKLRAAGLGAIGDLGFTALDDGPNNPVIITGRRADDEHGFAGLKNRRILTKVRMNATHATTLLRAPGADPRRDHPLTDDQAPRSRPTTGAITPDRPQATPSHPRIQDEKFSLYAGRTGRPGGRRLDLIRRTGPMLTGCVPTSTSLPPPVCRGFGSGCSC